MMRVCCFGDTYTLPVQNVTTTPNLSFFDNFNCHRHGRGSNKIAISVTICGKFPHRQKVLVSMQWPSGWSCGSQRYWIGMHCTQVTIVLDTTAPTWMAISAYVVHRY